MNNFGEEYIEQEDTQKGKYLKFALDTEVFGIAIKNVIEIIGMQPITPIPDVPTYMRGIVNLRGKIIPIIDVRMRFGKPVAEYNDRTSIIVVNIQESLIGLIVDFVSDVANIPDELISRPPDMVSGSDGQYIQGIGNSDNSVVLILDCDKLLSAKLVAEVQQ